MPGTDEENLDLVSSQHDVDSLNGEFYGRFPYPWPPQAFPLVSDPGLDAIMLNQSLGNWRRDRVPRDAAIWVAGCGTNQAIYTALKFPDATIVGSDISVSSLEISRKTAGSLGLTNIDFRQESLNQVGYHEQFDYIICTGVIHHNADPAVPLARISRALKAAGILELMVYNRYHRLLTSAVQKAVRIFSRAAAREADFNAEFKIAKAIINAGPLPPAVKDNFKDAPDARFADSWLQPVEHSYTIESFARLAGDCGLRLLLPCLTHHDYDNGAISWDTAFEDSALQRRYDGLADADRWQIGNLLLGGRSPMLWFYLCKTQIACPGNFEQVVCGQFLEQRFEKLRTSVRNYLRGEDGGYQLNPTEFVYPRVHENPLVRRVLDRVEASRSMGEILTGLGVDTANRRLINEIRIQTTSPVCPFLKAVDLG